MNSHNNPEEGLHQVQESWSPYQHLPSIVRVKLRQLWGKMGFNHDVASKLRYEVDMLLLRTRCALSGQHRRQVQELAGRKCLQLHLGCGNALLHGWINIDCYPPQGSPGSEILMIDMRRKWPFADGSARVLFSEHFLEHLPFETVRGHILREIRRILAPGGHVRIGVPNGEYFVEQYIASKNGASDPLYEETRQGKTPMTMLNEIAHGYGHYFAYDFETMQKILTEAGFTEIRRMKSGETEVDAFQGLDRNDPWRARMTLYVEGMRP
jgi:predicted SAM-dependent methyltransferase